MQAYVIKRLLQGIATVFGVLTIVFIIMNLTGDPVRLMVPLETPEEEIRILRHELGFDRPLPIRYISFVANAIRGDFGKSLYWQGRNAMDVVIERFPATLQLSITAVLWSIFLSLVLGIIAAMRRGALLDKGLMLMAVFGQTAPSFWVGIMLILIFSINLRLLPPSGRGTGIEYMIMPAFAMGLNSLARNTRFVRSCMLDVLSADYIITARAKGLTERAVILKHALKNAALPLITMIGLQFGALLGGAVILETVFAWPGVGRLVVQAIGARDFPVAQAAIFFIATNFVIVNLLVDVLYTWLDPRVKVNA